MEAKEDLFAKFTAKIHEVQSYGVVPNEVRMHCITRDKMLAYAPMSMEVVKVGDRSYDCLFGLPITIDNKVQVGDFVFALDMTIAYDLSLADRLLKRMEKTLSMTGPGQYENTLMWFKEFAKMIKEESEGEK